MGISCIAMSIVVLAKTDLVAQRMTVKGTLYLRHVLIQKGQLQNNLRAAHVPPSKQKRVKLIWKSLVKDNADPLSLERRNSNEKSMANFCICDLSQSDCCQHVFTDSSHACFCRNGNSEL